MLRLSVYRKTPLQSFHERLTDLQASSKRRDWLRNQLAATIVEEHEISERVEVARARLAGEQRDVERLERTTLLALFYELIGRREQQLDKERREAAAAALVLEECREELFRVRADTVAMNERLEALAGVEEAYRTTRAEARAWAKSTGNDENLELLGLADVEGASREWLREVTEAIDVGKRVMQSLGRLLEQLDELEESDVAYDDTFLGRLPRKALERLVSLIAEAHRGLSSFASELDDCRLHPDGKELRAVDRSLGVAFGVIFFDDMVTGWLERDHPNRAQRQVELVRSTLHAALSQLETVMARASSSR